MRSIKSIFCLIVACCSFVLWNITVTSAPAEAQAAQPQAASGQTADPSSALAGNGENTGMPVEAAPPAPEPLQTSTPLTDSIQAGPNGLDLTPFLDMFQDAKGARSVVDMILPENFMLFTAYDKRQAASKSGTLWLRFTAKDLPSQTWAGLDVNRNMLDLGLQVPGQAKVWLVRGDEGLPMEVEAGMDNVFQLPAPTNDYQVLIKIDGQPGLWFKPVLSTMAEATSSLSRLIYWLCLGALGVLSLLGLIRGLSERGDGRIWTGIFCGAALGQAFFNLPTSPYGSILVQDTPGVICAAVALLFLPHVGRQVTRSSGRWGFADTMFLLLAMLGAAVMLIPLMPGFAFTAPYISLWPAGAALALLPSLFLMIRGVRGSGLFALTCLLMLAGAVVGHIMIGSESHSQIWSMAPLIGVVAGSILLAVTVPRHALSSPAPRKNSEEESQPGPSARQADQSASPEFTAALRMEEILRTPLDSMLRNAFNLDQTLDRNLETPTREGLGQAKEFANHMLAGSRQISKLIGDFPRYTEQGYSPAENPETFELRRLIQRAFASVREDLSGKELGLAWYISPYIGLYYRGDRDRLIYILSMLLRDAIRATDHGMVSVRVRRAGMSINPGHLQFTISDSGKSGPPLGRSSLVLARTWELAASCQGELYVNSTPLGMEVTFGLNCMALEADGQTQKAHAPDRVPEIELPGPHNPNLVIVASNQPLNRQMFAHYLTGQGQVIWEARDAEQALAFYTYTPGAVVVFDGNLPEQDIIAAIAEIRAFEGEHLLPNASLMALSLDDVQAERLLQAGCTSSLTQPIQRPRFRQLVFDLATKPRSTPLPKPAINLQDARVEEEDGSKASLDVKLDLSEPTEDDLPPFFTDEPQKTRKLRFPWQHKKNNEVPAGVEPIVPLSYTITTPPTAMDGQISPDDLKSKAGRELAPLKLNRPKNLNAPPLEYFRTGYVGEPIPISRPAQSEQKTDPVPDPEPMPGQARIFTVEPDPVAATAANKTEGALVITAASLAAARPPDRANQMLPVDEQVMFAKLRQVIDERTASRPIRPVPDEAESVPEASLAWIDQEEQAKAGAELKTQPISFESQEACVSKPESEAAPVQTASQLSPVDFYGDNLETPEQPARASGSEATSSPDVAQSTSDRRLITTERTTHLHAQSFVLPAQPKKKKGWLSELFKPTPKLAEENPEAHSTEVSEPRPVARPGSRPYQPIPDFLRTDPPVTDDQVLPSWYNPWDSVESVGEPTPILTAPVRPELGLEVLNRQATAEEPVKPKKSGWGRREEQGRPEIPLPVFKPSVQEDHWLDSLEKAVQQAEQALQRKDSVTLQTSARLIGRQAETYALRDLADLSSYLAEASAHEDFATVSQILPDLQNEIIRQKNS